MIPVGIQMADGPLLARAGLDEADVFQGFLRACMERILRGLHPLVPALHRLPEGDHHAGADQGRNDHDRDKAPVPADEDDGGAEKGIAFSRRIQFPCGDNFLKKRKNRCERKITSIKGELAIGGTNVNTMVLSLILFAGMYVLLVFSEKRWIIALATAAVFLMLGILPAGRALLLCKP